MTDSVSDEILVAFLHGELPDAEMARVEAVLNTDPALAERAAALADQDTAIREAFAPVLAMPIPDRLHAVAQGPASSTEIVDFAAAKARRRAGGWGWPHYGAMAASLIAGVLGGQPLWTSGSGEDRAIAIAAADGVRVVDRVAAILSTRASGQAVPVAGVGDLTIALTFKTSDNRLCRQFSVQSRTQSDDGVACRDGARWSLEALGRRPAPAGELRTASGDAAPAVVTAVDGLIVGDPLVGEEELKALK